MVEEKTGRILSFSTEHTGAVSDDMSPEAPNEFEHRGAQISFVEGDAVRYLLISLPTGKKKAINLNPKS